MTKMEKTARKNKFKGIARRDFLKIAGLIGLGLTLEEALSACGATPLETPTSVVIAETAQPTPTEIPPTPDQVLEQYRKLIEEKGNSYVRILSAKARAEDAPLEEKLKTFVNKLIAGRHIEQATLDIYQSEEEAKAAGTSYSLGNINPYGAPYIAFFDEKTRRAGFIFDVWESDKPLIATKEDAWEVFTKELASNTEYANFVSEKTGTSAESLIPDDFHLTAETNRLADLVFTPTGEAFLGVNKITKQWEFIDNAGGLKPTPNAKDLTAETPANQKTEGVATSNQAVIMELVRLAKEGNIFPDGLTREQTFAFFTELDKSIDKNLIYTINEDGTINLFIKNKEILEKYNYEFQTIDGLKDWHKVKKEILDDGKLVSEASSRIIIPVYQQEIIDKEGEVSHIIQIYDHTKKEWVDLAGIEANNWQSIEKSDLQKMIDDGQFSWPTGTKATEVKGYLEKGDVSLIPIYINSDNIAESVWTGAENPIYSNTYNIFVEGTIISWEKTADDSLSPVARKALVAYDSVLAIGKQGKPENSHSIKSIYDGKFPKEYYAGCQTYLVPISPDGSSKPRAYQGVAYDIDNLNDPLLIPQPTFSIAIQVNIDPQK